MIFIKAIASTYLNHICIFYVGQPDGNVYVEHPNCGPSGQDHSYHHLDCYEYLMKNGDVDEMVQMVQRANVFVCYDQDTVEVFQGKVLHVRLFNAEFLLDEQPAVTVTSRAGMIRWMEETKRALLTADGFQQFLNFVQPGPHPNALAAYNVTVPRTLEQVVDRVCNRSSCAVAPVLAVPKMKEASSVPAYKLVDTRLYRTTPLAPLMAVKRTTKEVSGFGYKPTTDAMLPRQQRSVEYVDLTQDDDDEHYEPPSPKRTYGTEKQLSRGDGPSMGHGGFGRR